MDGTVAFWLGLGLSIPVAIIVNLLTPKLQRQLEKLSARYQKRRTAAREEDRKLAQILRASDRHMFIYITEQHAFTIRMMLYSVSFLVLGTTIVGALLHLILTTDQNSLSLLTITLGIPGIAMFLFAQQSAFTAARARAQTHRVVMLVIGPEDTLTSAEQEESPPATPAD